jgi:hypothetical protein
LTTRTLDAQTAPARKTALALAACVASGCFFDLAPTVPVMADAGEPPGTSVTPPPIMPMIGRPIVLATAQPEPWAIAVDETHVYWTNLAALDPNAGTLMRVRKDKSAPPSMFMRVPHPGTVALDATHVYWTSRGEAGGYVSRRPKNGGAAEVIATNQIEPMGLAVDEQNIYWTDYGRGGVYKRSKNDPKAVTMTVASGQQYPWMIVQTAAAIYWTNRDGNSVMKALKDGSKAPEVAAAALDDVFGIAVDEHAVYWRDADANNQGRVMRLTLDGTPPQQLAATGGEGARFLAIDHDHVYWTTGSNTDGSIMSALKDGSNVVELAAGQAGPRGIAVHGSEVYWSNYQGATIMKTSKVEAPVMRRDVTSRDGP